MTLPTSASSGRRLHLLTAYEARTDLLLSALALAYLVPYSVQMIFYDPAAAWFGWATAFGKFLRLLFAADLAFRIGVSPNRGRFLRTHILDVVTVVVRQFRDLRALRAFSSDGILSKKRGASGAEIQTLGDAIWWSFETITTVGYGDFVPVTWMGRVIATLVKQSTAPPTPTPADEVLKDLAELKQMVAALQSQLSGGKAADG